MTTLHLGVVDVAYSDQDTGSVTTTGDVAEILESKYHVMRVFLELNEKKIEDDLANAIAGAIESMAQGKRPVGSPLKSAVGKVEERFRDFLDADTMSRILPMTQQIQAAAAGVSSRKKSGKGKARPAFIDTGLYQASFRAWID